MPDNNMKTPINTPSLQVDCEVYAQMLEASNMSDAEKREFILTIWNLVVSFVDLGFEIHPVQQACGKSISLDEISVGDMLCLPSSNSKTEFNKSADPQSGGSHERSPICNQPPKP